MPRVLCVWFPNWPIQRLRIERPELKRFELVLFDRQNQRLLVTRCSPKAESLGVRIGQPLTEAKALLRKAVYLPADAAGDRAALCQLALDGQRFTPLVGLEEEAFPEALLCDVTGCTHLWDGEVRFLRAARDYWTSCGYHVQLALAETVGTAWALARASNFAVIPLGGEEKALSGLPIELLRLPVNTLERLDAIGLRTIGDVLRLPRETLASRFGVILPQRLDQALSHCAETFACERLREPITVVREWEYPVDDRLAVAFLCKQLIATLLSIADHPGMGLLELEGELRTETEPVLLTIRLIEPTRDSQHLAQLVELQLERQSWSSGVVAVRWTVLCLGRMPLIQNSWFGDDAETNSSRPFTALVDRLSSRLGANAVLRVEALPDPQPEYSTRLFPWTAAESSPGVEYVLPAEQSRSRPFRLLGSPQPIAVMSIVPDGPPIRMTWRGQECLVVRFWGPERIETGWWRTSDIQRDYYRVEWEDGSHVWIFRDQRGSGWFLHGFFE